MATMVPGSRSGASTGDQKQELALLVYELLGGVPPRTGSSCGYVPLPRLTSEGNAVLQRAVSPRPDQQFPSAKDFFDSLRNTAGYEPSGKQPTRAPAIPPKEDALSQGHNKSTRLAVIISAALVTLLIGYWLFSHPENASVQPIAETVSQAQPASPPATPIEATPTAAQITSATSATTVTLDQLLSQGYAIPPITFSPDKRYAVTVPSMALRDGGNAHNQLVEVQSGRVLATINAETYAEDPNQHMNWATLNPKWSADSTVLAWVVEGKWFPRAFVLLKVQSGAVEKQVDVMQPTQAEILAKTKAAAPEKYEVAKAKNAGNGTAFPDGFVVNIETPPTGFSLPLRCRVLLDSDPKNMASPAEQLRAKMVAMIDADAALSFTDFQITAEQGNAVGAGEVPLPEKVATFVRHFVQVNQVADANGVLACYADIVDYFDEGIKDHAYIRTDIEKYNLRWPGRRDSIDGNISVEQFGKAKRYIAKFNLNFYVESAARAEWIKGAFAMTLDIDASEANPCITAIGEKVLHREKGKIGASAAVALARPQTIARHFRGKGQVLQWADLQRYVGRQTSDVWGYGDLMLLQWNNPTAVFCTFANGVGGGSTLVEINWGRGISINGSPSGQWPNPGGAGTPIYPVARNMPFEVVSVSEQNGHLYVRARVDDRWDYKN
jgi:hypothetical protein